MGNYEKSWFFGCSSGRQPGHVKEASNQLSIRFQDSNGRRPGQQERFTRVGNLGEVAQLQWSMAMVCASEDGENSSSLSSGSQKEAV